MRSEQVTPPATCSNALRRGLFSSIKMQAAVVLVALLVAPAVIGLMAIPTTAQTDGPLPVINSIHAGVPEKFEEEFYEKILNTVSERSHPRSSSTTLQYYIVVVVVERYGPDGTDVSATNKARIVKELKKAGAKNIASAETLSFVTASVPVNKIVGLSTHEEVHLLGDGQLPLRSFASNPAVTVNATVAALATANGTADGSGARVAILDQTNIDYSFVNDKIVLSLDCSSYPCTPASSSPLPGLSHADGVAHFIGTTGHVRHNGISPGAEIVSLASGGVVVGQYYALDWAVSNDVDVVSMSIGPAFYCSPSSARFSINVISNDVVLSGTSLISATGNDGPGYKTVSMPCSYNIINVGGIDDRSSDITTSSFASRGPYHILDGSTRIATVMKPEIVAPATNVPIAVTAYRVTTAYSGTSLSAPQVSAAVAVLAGENDYLSPEDVRATLFLGADWTGPVPCTSVQFEQNDATDDCSYARQPSDANAASTSILNNVGFGILNVGQSLHYTLQGNGQHVVAGDLLHDDVLEYQFNITDTARPVKVILTWLNNAFDVAAPIPDNPLYFTTLSGRIYNLDLEVTCPGMGTIYANSAHQNNEFAVFMPNQTGTCTVQVDSSDSQPYDSRKRFALASTILFNAESAPPSISVTSPVNATVATLTVDFGNAIKPDTFTASDVTTSTGTVSEPTTGDNQTFRFNIMNFANEDVEISIAAGTVEYVSGNINAEAHAQIDRAPPTVVLSTITPSPTNAQNATFTAAFSEPVTFASGISDISVTGGTASNLSPSGTSRTFTFIVTPTGGGEVPVFIPAGSVADLAGNTNTASNTLQITFKISDPEAFITTWKTTTADESITLPISGSGMTVNWGDGNTATASGPVSHTYNTAGDHTIQITGELTRFHLNNAAYASKLVSLDQWGPASWTTMENAFRGASNMVYKATDAPDLSRVQDMSSMFRKSSFNGDISGWNVSSVTDMSDMFSSASAFNGDISGWNVSSVADMSDMFSSASAFNWNLNDWNVSSVTDMSDMFHDASAFNGDISGWNVSSVTDMSDMFRGASAFNGNISGWNVSSVTDMSDMFHDASAFNGDISDWNVSSVADMSNMFRGVTSFNGDLSGWNVSSVTDMSYMFYRASAFNGNISGWNVSSVTDMSIMFYRASAFNGNISGWNVSSVTDMNNMFRRAHSFDQPLNSWNVSSVTGMNNMFASASSFDQNLGKWYVVPADTAYDATTNTLNVTTISAQNSALEGHSPNYAIDAGGNSALFNMTGSTLMFKTTPSAGGYTVSVTASGSSVFESGGNWRLLEIMVTGQTTDTMAPVITITGSADIQLRVGDTYMEQGATCRDGVDADKPATVGGDTVDTSTPRQYTVTYDCTDSSNNDAPQVSRTVNVEAVPSLTAGAFVTTWKTTSADESITLPISGSGMTVNWGDGNTATASGPVSHTYNTAGDHTIQITGELTRFHLNNAAYASKLVSLDQWGTASWTTMENAFRGASNMAYNAADSPDLSSVTDMSYMFFRASAFNGDISGWNVSSVTDMSCMVCYSPFNGDISEWDVSSVTDMSYMFRSASFNGDISEWDVSSVTDMSYMFLDSTFNGNLGNWYIMLDNASVTGILQTVGNITTKNEFLATQGPAYGIGSSSDSEHFGINGTALVLTTIPDASPALVNITSTGDFGTSNSRIFEITFSPGVADTTNPRLESIERYSPASQNTDSQSLIYKATFSEDVTGVTASDFTLSSDSTGVESTPASTGQFTQTRSPNLDIPDLATVSDTITVSDSETAASVSVDVDITHNYIGDLKIDLIAPDGTTRTLHNRSGGSADDIDQTYAPSFGSIPISGVWKLQINDNYNADPGVLNSWTLTINYGDTTTTLNPVTGVSGSGDVYYVTVSSSTDGTYNLDLLSSGHDIADAASNSLTNASTTGADETYTVSTAVIDDTAPTLESIQRYTPATENTDSQSLIYKATFSEDVTGVTASDFTLSSDSTGVESTPASTGQFTQTRSPNLDIPDLATVSDTITVSDSETAASVSVDVDITHNYIGDLKIDLIAPDGTTRTLHNRSGGSADDIDQTYAPSFGSIPISGVWKLQINDNYNADPGVLNSWTLTINYGDTTTTLNPVTGVSGSGDVYYVTVSSSTDGTYNLDLLSSGHDIADAASNSLTNASTTGADETYTVSTAVIDDTAPTLESIQRYTPASQNTDSQTLIYKATFSEDVTGVTASDFTLSSDSTGVESTPASTGQFTQTRSPNLDIPDLQTVSDTITVSDSETAASVSVDVDITHNYIGDLKIDLIAPDGTSRTLHDNSGGSANDIDKEYAPSFGSISISGVWKLQIHDNYNADPGTLNSWTLTINYGDTTTTLNPVTGVSGSGDAYYVTVSATQDGTYNLDLLSSGHDIADAASNSLTNASTTGADETYTVSTAVIDDTAPTLESIQRYTPASQNTDSQTLIYKATFSEDVTGVTASDFTLSSDSTGVESTPASTGQFTQTRSPNLDIPDLQTVSDTITVSDSETAASVSVDVDITHNYIGDLKIDLIAPDGTSRTLHDNSGGSANDIDKEYAPSFGSISISGVWKLQIHDNYNADPGTLNSWTLTINYGDTTTTLNPVTGVSGSGDAYYVTVSATQDGTYNLDLLSSGHDIADAASNSLTNASTTGADETYTVSTAVIDDTAPTLESIQRYTPASQNTDSQTLIYKATFSEDVTGVTASDFTLSSDSTGVESTPASTGQFTQTRSPNLDIPDLATVSDTITVSDSETAASVSVDVDITHNYIGDLKIDLIAPDGTSRTLHDNSGGSANDIDKEYAPSFGSISISGVWKLQIHDNYNADPGTLNSWTLTINYGDTTTTLNPVTGVSGSGDAYYVTVSATQDGTYNLDLLSSGHDIADAASNSLTNASTTGADETYTVSTAVIDDTAPTLESIQRYTPATENTDSQSLIYKATFSEDVTGVTASDFTLSSDSTGVESTPASTGQFTQTRSPNLDIPDLATVSDTITVSDSETAASVSVDVDITHNYIGDLKIDLIAPDGTTKTLHNRSGGSADDIDQTYAPSFGSIPISGVWKLQIHDNYNADPGTLNSWTLTINYGDTTTTLNPVTGVSGSGDAYYVTVSATQDGTYNLDLVSSGHDIADAASNSLTNASTTGADETYTVSTAVIDDTAPTLESIQRYTPATENTDSQTLVYKVTFSEDVTEVDTYDFVLSPDSTGGGNNNNAASSEQFTQTRSPSSPITDNHDTSDAITVPNSGTVTSVSVTVNISHTFIGDLKVELVAPGGTIKTLHNRSGGDTNDIIKTYTPNFDDDDVQIQGIWKLKIRDNADGDTGTLNSWTLEVNYDTVTDTTVSPVTGISGSGDVYYVTVSAAQDGAYNLDLVSSGHDIEDAASNSLTNTTPTETDETYTVTAN